MFTPKDFDWNDETPDFIKEGNQRKFVSLAIAGFLAQALIVAAVSLTLYLGWRPAVDLVRDLIS